MGTLPAIIQNRPARQPRLSLIAIVDAIEGPDISDGRWHRGFTWKPERVTGGGLLPSDCQGTNAARTPDESLDEPEGDPYVVWASQKDSTFGFADFDYLERATRLLRSVESFHLAAELWDGAVAASEGNANTWLSNAAADTLTAGPVSVTAALASIEEALAFYLHGSTGQVHVSPQLMAHLLNATVLIPDGQKYLTPMGHRLVVDAGYTGNGPNDDQDADAASQWMYGTDPIDLLLGEVNAPSPARMTAEMDRSVNDIIVYADRMVGWRWDGQAHVAAEVNVGVSAIGGVS